MVDVGIVLIEKMKIHLEEMRWNLSARSILTRILNIIRRRHFVPRLVGNTLNLMILRQHQIHEGEPHMRPYFTIKRNEIFLDIGASIGAYTCELAPKCEEVHAWEPNPRNISILEINTKKIRNVIVHYEALGDEDGRLPLFLSKMPGFSGFVVGQTTDYTGRFVYVPVKRLDSYTFQGRIGLIKIDTEGYEVPVVRGALRTIHEHKPKLILEMHKPYEKEAMEIKELLTNYKWKRVFKEKSNGNNQFHLVGVAE